MPVLTMKFFDSPLQFIDAVFEKVVVGEGKGSKEVLNQVLNACKEEIVVGGTDLIYQLPFLTADNLTSVESGSLVRYRCMIQDMLGFEYFASLYSTSDILKPNVNHLNCGLWRETLQIPDGQVYRDDEEGRREISDRHIFVASPNPAEAAWVKKNSAVVSAGGPNNPAAQDTRAPRSAFGQCLLKVYDGDDQIKLNEVVEIIGLYYHTCNGSEDEQVSSSPSNIAASPTIHVFHLEKLIHLHPNPAFSNLHCASPDDLNRLARDHLNRALNGDVIGFREKLINAIKEHLMDGDELASEYLLCHLISSVYTRSLGLPMGAMSLNLFNIPTANGGPSWAEIRLYPVIERLLPQVSYLPLSLSVLNGVSFPEGIPVGYLIPSQSYVTHRLISAHLQLPKDTSLVIDETKLETGNLQDRGVMNVTALRKLIEEYELEYEYLYSTIRIDTDIRILIVSDGPSILSQEGDTFTSNFSLPLRAQGASVAPSNLADTIFGDQNFVDAARTYFSLVPLLDYKMDEDMQRRIAEDFVPMRQANRDEVKACYLTRLLTMSRLLGKTYGERDLTVEIWEKAKHMEAARCQRSKETRRC